MWTLQGKSYKRKSLAVAHGMINMLKEAPEIAYADNLVQDGYDFELHDRVYNELYKFTYKGYPAVDSVMERTCYGYTVTREEFEKAIEEVERG